MTLSGSDTLLYTLAFLVPGFIIDWVLSAFAARRKQDSQILLLRFLTLSCANYALWSLPIYYSITTRLPQTHPFVPLCFMLSSCYFLRLCLAF